MTPSELLAAYAPAAGLGAGVRPFVGRGSSLRFLLARNPLLMAPMAGVSDGAYRLMARAGGAALAYTEMVSVAGIHYGSDKTWDLVLPVEGEPDLAVQLFGSRPEQFEEAAALVAERLGERLALIDVNMACPVRKVVSKGEGSALLDEPARAEAIVRACRRGVCDQVPVTCKIRLGRRDGEEVAPDFARRLEQAGASAIAVHGRTAAQLYRGRADWGVIRRVAEATCIPTIGSGDVTDARAAARLLDETGATAVMVARGSYGNPWLFCQAQALRRHEKGMSPTIAQRLDALGLHLQILEATGGHLVRGRSVAGWYLKGLPHASVWRDAAMSCVTLTDFLDLLDDARDRLADEGADV